MSAPEQIYLQWIEDESHPYIHEGVTWCADRIEDDDVEYVRADKADSLREALKGLSEMYTFAWDRIDGGLVTFDIERFEAAHKKAKIALGTPLIDLDTGEPEA